MVSAQVNSNPETATHTQKHREGGFKKLNLSEDQKQQLKALRAGIAQKVQSVLTEEQRAKLAAAKQSGQYKGVWKSLGITADQKQQLQGIRKNYKEQSLAILTPEQRSQLEQTKAQHHRR